MLSKPEPTRSFQEMSLRDPEMAEISRAFEQVSIQRLTSLISAIVPRDVVPDPEATAWVLHGSAMHTALGLAGHYGPPPISADRARKALTDFIERALFPSRGRSTARASGRTRTRALTATGGPRSRG